MRLTIIIGFLCYSLSLLGQENLDEKLVVPLSDPGERGQLEVNQVNGDIIIEGYNGKEVIINAKSSPNGEGERKEKHRTAPPGMKRISTNQLQITAREDDNQVEIDTQSWKRRTDLNIKVPTNFDLHLHTVHGIIDVKNVNGEMEVSGVNGGISLDEINGSAVCNTVNGDVVVRFKEITTEIPMSFVTLNGNVDITFPGEAGISAKMKSERGEIYTDFDMDTENGKPQVKRGDDCDCEFEISVNSWTFGDINGGGAEMTFKNMNGDILIRKRS